MANQLENIAGLQSILETVNSLPEAGSGGGGGTLETCTVTVTANISDFENAQIVYTTVENGVVTAKREIAYNKSFSCLCGSAIIVHETGSRVHHEYAKMELLTDPNSGLLFFVVPIFWVFQLTAAAGEEATLRIYGQMENMP